MLAFLMVLTQAFVSVPEFLYGFFIIETLLHLLLYTILAFIPMIFFKDRKTTFLIAISIAPLGYLIENIHAEVIGTYFDAVNALVNNVGILIGIITGFIVRLKSHYLRKGNP